MSSTRFEPSLRIEPQSSPILKWFLFVNFFGATVILMIVFPILISLPLGTVLWFYFFQLYQCYILQCAPQSVRLLIRETTGDWLLYTVGGGVKVVTLSPSSYIHPQLIILILKVEGEHYILPLLRESLSQDCFRALSVWIRMRERSIHIQ